MLWRRIESQFNTEKEALEDDWRWKSQLPDNAALGSRALHGRITAYPLNCTP